jgi:drug/metabolite transporter (DMT)-like permease
MSLTQEQRGLWLGFLGVLAFSLTLPTTRIAVQALNPWFVGLGRSLFAGLLALVVLIVTRQPLPRREHLKGLLGVSIGVVLGFPMLITWAMREVPAAHGAIVIGLLPLATAMIGSVMNRERPSAGFWFASAAGSLLVVGFALVHGGGSLVPADLTLFFAVVLSAWGYAAGAKLTPSLGGWQTISWALVLSLPVVVVPMAYATREIDFGAVPAASWAGFVYLVLMSQYLGFVVWYRGLAIGGIARVSQMQLTQVFLTMLFAALLLGEHITLTMVIFAVAVVATVAIGRRMPVARTAAART